MPFLLVSHKVKNYDEWKTAFDAHSGFRRANGSLGERLFDSAFPNEVAILFEWDDLQKARHFAESVVLRDTVRAAGAGDEPNIYFFAEHGATAA